MIRKLCSSLVAIFVQSDGHWSHCVRHVLHSFHVNRPLGTTAIENEVGPSADVFIEMISAPQLIAAQWFATALLEDVEKMNTESILMYSMGTLI